MAGLLSPGFVSAGLLGMGGITDKADEYFLRSQIKPRTYEGLAPTPPKLLSGAQPSIAAPMPAGGGVASPPVRGAVNPLRVALSTLLSGTNPFEALDAERVRLDAEAQRPTLLARQNRLRTIAEQMGPAAMLAYELNPEEFGKNVAERFGTDNVGAGAALYTDGVRIGEQPTFAESGDTTIRRTSQGVEPVWTRTTPSIAETNDANKTAADIAQAEASLGYNYDQLAATVQNNQATQGINQAELGLKQDAVTRELDQAATARTNQASQEAETARSMREALTSARRYLPSAGVISAVLPFNQDRANLEGRIDTLKGNLSLDKLMTMKENSPTGASGLGALSDSELRLLGATAASLDPNMSPGELARSFATIDRLVQKMEQSAPAAAGAPAIGTVEDGYRFTGGNPASASSWVRIN